MGLFDFWKPKTTEKREATPQELELREHNRQLNMLKKNLDMEIMVKEAELRKAEIEADLAEMYGDDEDGDDVEGMFGNFLKTAMTKNVAPQQAPQQMAANQEISLTDEQLKQYWEQMNPIYKAVAKGMSDENIKEFIKQKEPRLNQDTLNRAVAIVKA